MINISEGALEELACIPSTLQQLVQNGERYLRRVYPAGSHIQSGNLNPLTCWRAGSHFAAVNMQTYDLGLQLNEAMFFGTSGWVPKPTSLLGEEPKGGQMRFKIHIYGLSSRAFD